MQIEKLTPEFSVCKVERYPISVLEDEFCFACKTERERSLVCVTENAPDNALERDDGWRAMRIVGTLDFSLIGILAKIASILAENNIGIFAVSTYDTDYILTKAENFNKALQALEKSGYEII